MKRKIIVIAVALPFFMSGCVPIDKSKPPEPGAIRYRRAPLLDDAELQAPSTIGDVG